MSIPVSRVNKKYLVDGLRELGLTAGAGLIVHSSLSSFGHLEGGAQTVIAALMEIITSEGTLLMPSFNHKKPFRKGGAGYFHPKETPTINGAIPDLFWRMPDVHKSLNPTHPFAAWGKHSRRYTQFHHRTLTMGPRSPLGLVWADRGFGLLLGVRYNTNAFHHVVETSTGAPCLGLRTEAHLVMLPDGRKVEGRTWSWREKNCPYTDGDRYVDEMRSQGLQKEVLIGNCRAILFRLEDCFALISDILKRGKDGFPPCSRCPIRPLQGPYTVPSDWDRRNNCLLPHSTARTF